MTSRVFVSMLQADTSQSVSCVQAHYSEQQTQILEIFTDSVENGDDDAASDDDEDTGGIHG